MLRANEEWEVIPLKTKRILTGAAVLVLVLIAGRYFGGPDGTVVSYLLPDETQALAAGTAKAVFAVHCYDEGRDALKNIKGVTRVERGFRNFREINTVYYDPKLVSLGDLEQALKKAGTYVETMPSH
jgi:copper chaperone CopZ